MSLLALALVVGFPIGSGFYQRRKLALRSHVVTLAEFSASMPKPQKVVVFEKDGSSYVEVIGLPPSFPAVPVPSGPPAYIFDSKGHISYWTADVGDSTEYWKKWQNRANIREVSMKDGLEFVKGVKQRFSFRPPNKTLQLTARWHASQVTFFFAAGMLIARCS